MREALTRRIGQLFTDCMADAGFPQPAEAARLRRSGQGVARRTALNIEAIDFGPATEDQAKKYGFFGVNVLFDEGEPGLLRSNDPSFEEAGDKCNAKAEQRSGQDLDALQSQAAALETEAAAAFRKASRPLLEPLMVSRFECVRDEGFPRLDPARFLAKGSPEDLNAMVGIPVGTTQSPSVPDLNPAPGEVLVAKAPGPARYIPSPEEVKFALTFVKCGDTVDFAPRLKAITDEVRPKVLDGQETRIQGVGQGLQAALKRLS